LVFKKATFAKAKAKGKGLEKKHNSFLPIRICNRSNRLFYGF
jgi:hypothetical protein